MTDGSPLSDQDDEIPIGVTLARLRRAAGFTGQELGALTGMSQPKISRIETGTAQPDPRDVRTLARALDLDPTDVQRLVDRAERAQNRMTDWRPGEPGVADRQREVAQVEHTTREFRVFQPAVIVGLLQTSEYARAILTPFQLNLVASRTGDAPGVVSEAVSARVRRHEVLADQRKKFHFVMTESVLTNRVCRPTDMLAQIERLREVARQDNVKLGIIPERARLSIPPYHGFELLDDRYVMVDLFNTTLMSRGRVDTSLYRQVFDNLQERAETEIDEILDRHLEIYLDLSRPKSRR